MKTSTKRAVSLIGTAGLIVLTLAVYSLLLKSAYTVMNKSRGELAARRHVFSEQVKIITKVRDLIAQYQGTAKIQDTIALTLPSRESSAAIIDQLTAIAGASGVIPQSVTMQQGTALKSVAGQYAKSVGVLEVAMSMIGTYDAFKTFVHGIETNIRLMDIKELRVDTATRGSSGALNFNLAIQTYYQVEN